MLCSFVFLLFSVLMLTLSGESLWGLEVLGKFLDGFGWQGSRWVCDAGKGCRVLFLWWVVVTFLIYFIYLIY